MSRVPPPPLPPPSPSPSTERESFQAGRFVFGALVALFGVAWLLEATDVWHVPWKVVLPVTLTVLGVALLLSARARRGQGGLITLGIILTVVLAIGTVVDVPFEGGVGDRVERPRSYAELKSEYGLSIGKLTVDLSGLPTAASARTVAIRARVGIGQLTIIVPEGVAPEVHATAGVGSVEVFGKQDSGLNVKVYSVPHVLGPVPYSLDLSTGIGDIEVRRG
jgi:hypothetical protein